MAPTSARSPSAVQSSSAAGSGRSGGVASRSAAMASGAASNTWPFDSSRAAVSVSPSWTHTVHFAPIPS